jgi:protein-S-isoprenylcysteine O-methyltransferase Ste14
MSSFFVKKLQRYRVFSGFAIAAVYLYFAKPSFGFVSIGFALAVIGLAIRAWACGHIRKIKALDTSGPYAYTRNPIYFGTFLIAVGFAVLSGVWWLAALTLIFFVSIYLPVMRVEAEELEEVIGYGYREYAAAVPLFFPRLSPWNNSDPRSFDFGLYFRHGEYNAILGLLGAAVILAIKFYFFG